MPSLSLESSSRPYLVPDKGADDLEKSLGLQAGQMGAGFARTNREPNPEEASSAIVGFLSRRERFFIGLIQLINNINPEQLEIDVDQP